MSLDITASPDPVTGTVALSLEASTNVVTLTRSDTNGTRPVRLPAGALPASGTLTLKDFEPALAGQVQYRAYTATEEASAWVTLGAQLPRFVMPSIPLYSVEVDTVHAYTATRSARATVHDVVGRRDPIVVQGVMGTRRGVLGVVCDSYNDVMRVETIMKRGQTVFYRQSEHAGTDMYFSPLEVSTAPASGKWEVTVNYVELDYPTGPVQSDPAWTFQKLASTATTFAGVATDYTDFASLALNQKKTP